VGVKAVVLFFRFQAGNTTEWQNESMSPVGGDLYERTVDVGALFNGSVPFDQATLQYQAVLQNSSDDISARTDVFSNISVLACQVPPPEATQSACSTFVDPRTCAAQGCQWSAVPGTSPTRYICKNP
jgi:hypothetical protein